MRRALRRTLKIMAWIAGSALVILVLALGLLHTDWGRDRIRGALVAQLDARLRGSLEVERLGDSVLFGPSLHGVVLRDESGEVVARIAKIQIDYSLRSLLGDEIAIESIALVDPWVLLELGPDGEVVLADMWIAEEETAGPPLRLRIGELGLSGGEVIVAPHEGPRHTLTDLALGAADLEVAGPDLQVAIEGLSGRWVERDRSFALAGEVDVGDEVSVRELTARFGASTVDAPSVVVARDLSRVALEARLAIDAADVDAIAPELAWRGDLQGSLAVSRAGADAPIAAELDGTLAGAPIAIELETDADGERGRGRLHVGGVELQEITARAPPGRVAADLALQLDELDGLQSTASISGTVSGRYREWVLDRGELDVQLADGVARGELEAVSPRGRVTASGAAVLDADPIELREVRVSARVDRIEELTPPEVDVSGQVSVDATVSGPIDAMEASGRARAERARYQDIRARAADLRFDLSGLPGAPEGTVRVDATGVVRGGDRLGRVRARARLRDRGRDIDVHVESGERGDTRVVADARIRRDGDRTAVQVERVELETPGGTRVSTRGGRVTVGGAGELEVEDLDVAIGEGRLHVDGSLRRGLTIRGRALDVATLWREAGLAEPAPSGTVAIHGELGGDLDHPLGVVELTVDDLRLRDGAPLLQLSAVLTSARDNLAVDLVARGDEVGRVTTEVDVRPPRRLTDAQAWSRRGVGALRELEVVTEELRLAGVYALLGRMPPAAGTIDARLAVGDRASAVELQAALRGGAVTSVEGAEDLAATVTASIRDRDASLAVEAVIGDRGQAILEADARLPGALDEPRTWQRLGEDDVGTATLVLDGVQLERLRDLVPAIGEVTGRVDALAELSPRARRGGIQIRLTDLRPAEGRRPVDVDLDAVLGPQALTAELRASSRGAKLLTGRAELPVSYTAVRRRGAAAFESAPVEARVESQDLPLQLVAELADFQDVLRRVEGEVDLLAEVTGRLDEPVLSFRAALDRARLDDVRFSEFAVAGTSSSDGLAIEADAVQARGGRLALESQLRYDDLSALDIKMRARKFDLSFLASLDRDGTGPLAGVAGTVDASMHLQGTPAEPLPSGWVRLQGGRVRLRGGLQPLSNIYLVVRADEQELTAELRARSGAGRTRAELAATLKGEPLRLITGTIEVEDLPYAAGNNVVSISADTRLEVERKADLWAMTATIDDATVRLPKTQTRDLHPLDELDEVTFVEEISLSPLRADAGRGREPIARIKIEAPRNIRIRSEEIDATVAVDLDVTLTEAGSAVTGTVSVTRGRIELFDRRYDVVTTELAFGGQIPPNPQLSVQLEHDFGELVLGILVTGTLDEPRLVMTSEPAIYDQATLLAIVLGRNPSGPDAGEQGLEQQALGVASGFLLGKIRGVVQEVLPIDVLRLDTGAEGRQSVYVGKWISDDLFVAYRYRTGTDELENANEAQIEYKLTNRWSLEGTYGDRGSGGLDLLWVKRY